MHIDAIPVCVTDAPDGLTGQRDKAFSSSKAMQNSFCNTWNTLFKTYISSPLTLRAKKCVCKLNYSSDHGLIRYLIFSHSCSYNVYIFTVFSPFVNTRCYFFSDSEINLLNSSFFESLDRIGRFGSFLFPFLTANCTRKTKHLPSFFIFIKLSRYL